jgi:hypothetical protein
LLAVVESQVAVGFGIVAVHFYRFFVFFCGFVELTFLLIGFAFADGGVGFLTAFGDG